MQVEYFRIPEAIADNNKTYAHDYVPNSNKRDCFPTLYIDKRVKQLHIGLTSNRFYSAKYFMIGEIISLGKNHVASLVELIMNFTFLKER